MDDDYDYLDDFLEREECPECGGTLVHDQDDDEHICTICSWSNVEDEGEPVEAYPWN